LVDQRDELLDFGAPRLGHLEIEGTGNVQRLEVLHPVERHVVVAPGSAHRDRNLVIVLALEAPVVDGGNVLDDVHRVGGAFELDLQQCHWSCSPVLALHDDVTKAELPPPVTLNSKDLPQTPAVEPRRGATLHAAPDSDTAVPGASKVFFCGCSDLLP